MLKEKIGQLTACCLSILLVSTSAAWAQTSSSKANPDPLVNQRDARHWLDRIQKAASHQNYTGVFIYQQGSAVQASRIEHFADFLNNEFEHIESLDGVPREVYRHNNEVYTLFPAQHLRLFDKRDNKDTFPSLIANPNIDVLVSYDLRKLNTDRVAGQECQQMVLEPKDNLRYGYRLCIESQTGLLLRAQTIGEGNRVLEQIAFSQIKLNAPSEKQKIQNAIKTTANWTQHKTASQAVNMSQGGWVLAPASHGFKKIKELRRNNEKTSQAQSDTYQVIYSDGLAGISVFIEPNNDKSPRQEGQTQRGATNVMSKRLNQYWVTVVGEAPMSTVKYFTQAVEKK